MLGGTIKQHRAFISHLQNTPDFPNSFNIELGGTGGYAECSQKTGVYFAQPGPLEITKTKKRKSKTTDDDDDDDDDDDVPDTFRAEYFKHYTYTHKILEVLGAPKMPDMLAMPAMLKMLAMLEIDALQTLCTQRCTCNSRAVVCVAS